MTAQGNEHLKEAVKDIASNGVSVVAGLSPVSGWLSTGCTLLDLAIADQLPGGFPAGRISHVYGAESTCKTVLVSEPLGSVQRQGGKAYFADAEGTLDGRRARDLFGVNVEDDNIWSYSNPETLEDLFDKLIPEAIKETADFPMSAFAVDSLSALPAAKEIGQKLGEGGYGMVRAKQLSTAFRTKIHALNKANLGLLFVDQARDDINNPFKKDRTSSGRAILYYSCVRVRLRHKAALKNKAKRAIGCQIAFEVEKNKVAPPFRKGTFDLYFDYGIDDVGTNLKFFKQNTKPKDTRYEFGEIRGTYDKVIDEIENQKLEGDLRQAVWDIWKTIYVAIDRRHKIRFD